VALFSGQLVNALATQSDVTVKFQTIIQGAANGRQQTGFARAAGPHHAVDDAVGHVQVQLVQQRVRARSEAVDVNVERHQQALPKGLQNPSKTAVFDEFWNE
jgi:hypothetical protein